MWRLGFENDASEDEVPAQESGVGTLKDCQETPDKVLRMIPGARQYADSCHTNYERCIAVSAC
jgi:hypothetical protein